MNDRIHRHMIFNKELKYNKISFKLKVKLLDSKGKEEELIKKSNLELKKNYEFEKTHELMAPKFMKKDSNIKKHDDEIKKIYEEMKCDFYEFLNLVRTLNLEIESIDYKEEYFIE